MIRVIILGAGNVAKHLYNAFYNQQMITIVQCYNRKGLPLHSNQRQDAITSNISALKEADVYILAVNDDAIKEVSELLPFRNRLVVHTSGSVPMSILNTPNRKGVFYPLQTFSKDKNIDFSTIPFCLESENKEDTKLLKKIAYMFSEKVYDISSEQRNILHVSAVFVNNFTNHLFSIGNDICATHGIPFEILHPLIAETIEKITQINPDLAQTGPALRNDTKTIERHLGILTDTTQQEIYQTLTKAIQSKYGKEL